jgi:formamidopyrimidine-DNA glycosylase
VPELPEVETIKRQLSKDIPCKILRVKKSEVVASILKDREFNPVGKSILKIKRIGKTMEFDLGDGLHILSQFGMSGGWVRSDTPTTLKHNHFEMKCENKKGIFYLSFVDPRRFGNIYIVKTKRADEIKARLGIDVSSKEFTADSLYTLLQKHSGKEVKPFLLEQKYLSGVGNYMASEICALSKILPTRLCKNISKLECKKIVDSTKKIIDGMVKSKGNTFSGGYRDATGEKGEGVKNLVVFYQKTCGMCGKNPVTKIEQKGRGTYYCSKCQK